MFSSHQCQQFFPLLERLPEPRHPDPRKVIRMIRIDKQDDPHPFPAGYLQQIPMGPKKQQPLMRYVLQALEFGRTYTEKDAYD